MTIETKFSVGDAVWLLKNNKAVSGEVRKIDLTITLSDCHEVCTVNLDSGSTHQFCVSYLFPTKQALLESL